MATITLLSWNVHGARAIHRAGFLPWLGPRRTSCACMRPAATRVSSRPRCTSRPATALSGTAPSGRRGYSGTALLTRVQPLCVRCGLGDPQFDDEGCTIVTDYGDLTLVNCYFPNGGRHHKRVPYKLAFYEAFLAMCERLRGEERQIILCATTRRDRAVSSSEAHLCSIESTSSALFRSTLHTLLMKMR